MDYICWDAKYFPVGHGYQIALVVEYTPDDFNQELQRLSQAEGEGGQVQYNTEYFSFPAYVTVWSWNSTFEYALIDEQTYTICFVYLQHVGGDSQYLKLEQWQLPIGIDEYHEGDFLNNNSFCNYSIWESAPTYR